MSEQKHWSVCVEVDGDIRNAALENIIDMLDKFGVLKYRAGCSTQKTSVELNEQAHAYRHMIHEALASLSQTSPTPKQDSWQPIETAPKGQKIIVGYVNNCGKWRTVMARYFPEGTLQLDDDTSDEEQFAPAGWYEESESHCENLLPTDEQPTRWQPLPPALQSPDAGKE